MTQSIADLCRDHQVTLTELVTGSGLEEGRVAAILLCRWTPSPVERQKIAAVFNISADQITWGHKTPIQHLYGHGPG